MIIIASAGYAVNYWISKIITSRPDVVSAISMFAVGVLGQLWSRIGRGSAFTSMVTGVLLVVPSGIAAAGGLAMSGSASNSGYDSVSQGFLIGLRMMVVAIGLVVGLFMSTLVSLFFVSKSPAADITFRPYTRWASFVAPSSPSEGRCCRRCNDNDANLKPAREGKIEQTTEETKMSGSAIDPQM